jgi:hypothetical protein
MNRAEMEKYQMLLCTTLTARRCRSSCQDEPTACSPVLSCCSV